MDRYTRKESDVVQNTISNSSKIVAENLDNLDSEQYTYLSDLYDRHSDLMERLSKA